MGATHLPFCDMASPVHSPDLTASDLFLCSLESSNPDQKLEMNIRNEIATIPVDKLHCGEALLLDCMIAHLGDVIFKTWLS